ncbi:MAG TPA: cytochrome c biogenesis protein CcsA [Vicinamibacteria bacterium]|nr:cytochrome c biogenesis protein CcsA [Vicinamibacteria bacterium]
MLGLAGTLLTWGSVWGLFFAPPEFHMGDVYRILYIHVPTAWNAMLAFTACFVLAVLSLAKGDFAWDARLEATMEVGVVLSLLLCLQGSIWAKPTWGVFWDWDPRLTTTAVMVSAFAGILALRRFVDDPVKRATWSAVAAIVASADVPIVYFSVRWWNSLHQTQSSPETVSVLFHWPLRINAIGMLLLMLGLVMLKTRTVALRLRQELAPPLPQAQPARLGAAAEAGGAP